MTINPDQLTIHHNKEAMRFEIDLGDARAIAAYTLAGQTMIFTDTEVPEAYQGQGIAGRLVGFALDYARAEGYHVQALCSYVVAYIERHPEYRSLTRGNE